MRKLASKGVNSIDSLLASDPYRIELILGKPPPFGNEVLKKVSSFPNLMVSIKEMERKFRTGKGVTLKLKCEVGFLNDTVPLKFGRALVHVCFLLEDSNGMILDFRRFGARKLENGEDIFLTVELKKPTACVRSYVMCDELAGTTRYAELHLRNVPASVYPKPANAPRAASADSGQRLSHSLPKAPDMGPFDDDGVRDEELLAAATRSETIAVVKDIDECMLEMEGERQGKRQSRLANKSSTKSSPDDDDDEDQADIKDPVQLDNGRWTCQHLCKDKGIECKHKCCRDGVTKPRRRPKKALKTLEQDEKQRKLTSLGTVTKKSSSSSKSSARSLDKLQDTFAASARPRGDEQAGASSKVSKKRKLGSINDEEDNASLFDAQHQSTKRHRTSAEASARIEDEQDMSAAHESLLDEKLVSDGDLWDPEDCDWNLPPSYQESDNTPGHGRVGGVTGSDQDFLFPDNVNETGRVSSSIDQVPINHVQLKPGMGLFITGKSSSPVKLDRHATSRHQQLSSDSFFGTPIRMDDFADEASNQQVPAFNQPPPVTEGPRNSLTSGSPVQMSDVTAEKENKDSKLETDETEEERKQRLWEEDQKRRWDQLEPWMYEQFHTFVELV